ncbi:hypothetical protein N7528_005479 [Penicillium herquei]|nr:hypothetical protein N7528_005479 [Penicillium herquei]
MVYKACKLMNGACRGHQYPGNFSKNGSIRPDVPLSALPQPSQATLGYYGLVPESVAREVGYLIRKKTNDNTTRRYLFGFGAITLGPKYLTSASVSFTRQAIDFDGGFDDDLDLQQPVRTRFAKEVMAPNHTRY